MRLITDDDVAASVDMREAIAAMTAAFEQFGNGAGAVAPRTRAAAEHGTAGVAISAMGAALAAAGVVGAKAYSTLAAPDRATRSRFAMLLFSARSGEPLAALEANEITRLRTAAVSAVALRALAPAAGATGTLALFGAGVQAHAHAEAFLLTRRFERVLVAARSGGPALADRIGAEFGVPAAAVDGAAAARDADVIATCTRSALPLFDGSTVRPGALVIGVGSAKPTVRELDDALLARAERIVVEWLPAAQADCGEFALSAPGVIDPTRVLELGRLLVDRHGWQRRRDDIVVFKSVGIALADVALARLVWERTGG